MATEQNKEHQILRSTSKKKEKFSITSLAEGISQSNVVDLARAITLVESARPEDVVLADKLLTQLVNHGKTTLRIGITGVPGVGKSTFIEAFGNFLVAKGKKIAVLAVDPTSSLSKGSILGDKTRMETLAKHPNVFVRPSPAGDSLGGVSRKTRESIVLCEAAGFDIVLVETVGVGQSETAVHGMVDFFLLLKLAGAGDELQGIKRGIMEMADAIIINKADGNNIKPARLAKTEFARALHLYPPKLSGWIPKVLTVSSTQKIGLEAVWKMLEDFLSATEINGFLRSNRIAQNKKWFEQSLSSELKRQFLQNSSLKKAVDEALSKIDNNQISPFHAATELVKKFLK